MHTFKRKYCSLMVFALTAMTAMSVSFSERYTPFSVPGNSRISFSGTAVNSNRFLPSVDLNADSLIIPLKQAGRLFLIDARIDGETGNLVFDTGAKDMVLNSTYFRNYKKNDEVNAIGVTGSMGTVEHITVGKIEFSELEFKNQTVEMANLGHIENRRGVKILGLIGFSMLKNFEIVIDPGNSELKLFKIDKSGKRPGTGYPGFKPDYIQKIEGNNQILFLKCTIGGRLMNFCFDTAAETNVVNSASNKSILGTLTITRRSVLKGAGTDVSEVLFGKMNDFSIGDVQVGNMETIVANLRALSELYNKPVDGILGFNFLKNSIVCVNFINNQVGIRFVQGDES